MLAADVCERRESACTGHVQIKQQQIGIGMLVDQELYRCNAVGFMQRRIRNRAQHRAAQRFAKQRMVVGDQDFAHWEGIGNRETGMEKACCDSATLTGASAWKARPLERSRRVLEAAWARE